MNDFRNKDITDSAGLRGRVTDMQGDDVVVRLEHGDTVLVPASSLREQGSELVTTSAFGGARAARGSAVAGETGSADNVVPVVEETLEVGTRTRVTGGVRLTKTVHEREELVDEPTVHEDVEVERVAVGRVVEAAPEVRREGDTTIYPVLEEEVVVHKRLVLKEEIRVTKRRVETRDPQRVTLRREEVQVEDLAAEARGEEPRR